MIEDLTNDSYELVTGHEDTNFSEHFDYASAQAQYQAGAEKWRSFSKEEKAKFSGSLESFLQTEGIDNPRHIPSFPQVKNLYLLRTEIKAQIDSDKQFRLLGIEEFNATSSLIQLLEHMENTTHIREIYRQRKLTVGRDSKSGISEEQARVLRNCMRQGRDLFLSGQNGSLMIKPLVWFYSLTAYAYACIILNSPIRYSLDTLPSSHGLNYLPLDFKAQFGGSIKQGTFSELFAAFPTTHIQNSLSPLSKVSKSR